jgi:adenylate kinase
MKGKFILMTGVPGVGKSTIARNIQTRITPIVRIGFGELIFEVKQQQETPENYGQFKAKPDKSIPINYVNLAREVLLNRVDEFRDTTNIILDSHAVVNDYFGFRIVPEIIDFERAKVDAVIVIHAPFEIVKQRVIREPKERNLIPKQTFKKHQVMQDAVAIHFSLMARCPMYVVETDDDLNKSVRIMIGIFQKIGMSFLKNLSL